MNMKLCMPVASSRRPPLKVTGAPLSLGQLAAMIELGLKVSYVAAMVSVIDL